jgi:alpha-N-arabinofuranosidase
MASHQRGDSSDSNATDDNWLLSRRRFLATQSLALSGLVVSGNAVSASTGDNSTAIENTVSVSPSERNETPVSDQLFGRMAEHYCSGTIYPGVYSEHIKNNSFYPRTWSEEDFFGPKTFFNPASIERHKNIPFPWEPISESGVTFEQREGGVSAAETTDYQRVSLSDARGGISQKIVLPDFRTLEYDLSLSVRGEEVETVTATIKALMEPTEDQFEVGETVATADVDVSGDWERHEVALELSEALGDEYVAGSIAHVDTPYSEYVIELSAEGSGHVDLDWIMLGADDAVNGKFNPSTVELMEEQDTTWLKWPGGNFTSQYNWRDGIGPLDERPVRFNHAWGGIDPNYFGTDEYLELCDVCDITPRITIGWWPNPPEWAAKRQILPEDAADWVEYCNGSAGTEMGRLRKENGHPGPYDIEYWEVGNEVYGPWQRGHTDDPSEFANGSNEIPGFNAYSEAMNAVDDSITVYADAMSPRYEEPNLPDPDNWNETLFELSGDRLDGVDLHHYSWGMRDAEARHQWYEENTSGTPKPGYWEYSETLIMFPTQFGVDIGDLSAKAGDYGIEDFEINVGEYGCFPAVDGPYPGPETMPGGSYIAGMLNAFIRQSETIRAAAQTWVPVRMFPPEFTEFPPDPNPLAPAGAVYGIYSEMFDGHAEWHAVDVTVSGASQTIPETGPRIRRMEDVPYVDAAAMQDKRGKELCAFLTNRNLWENSNVTLNLGERYAGETVSVTHMRATADERPLPHNFQQSWKTPDVYELVESETTVEDDGSLTLTLGPASIVRLHSTSDDSPFGDDFPFGDDSPFDDDFPFGDDSPFDDDFPFGDDGFPFDDEE